MKIAICGKGGSGKTMLAGTLSRLLARDGFRVISVDADPNPNLHISLGFSQEDVKGVTPISEMKDLIDDRARIMGGVLSLTPRVDDIPRRYWLDGPDGVKLLLMGAVRKGGGGCTCPENALLRALVRHLIFERDEFLVMDMEAGVEHLGRGTAKGVDVLVGVTEPSWKSLETLKRVKKLAEDIGLRKIYGVGNKLASKEKENWVRKKLEGLRIEALGCIPYDKHVLDADFEGRALIDSHPNCIAVKTIERLKEKLLIHNTRYDA